MSAQSIDIGDIKKEASTDILTYTFEGPECYDRDCKPLYIDAEDPSRYLTATQALGITHRLIAGFKHAGIQSGDRVLVHLPSSVIYSSIVFGIIGARGIYTASNPGYRKYELDHLLALSKPAFIITLNELLPVVLQSAEENSIRPDSIYILDSDSSRYASFAQSSPLDEPPNNPTNGHDEKVSPQTFQSLLQHGESDWYRITDEQTARSTHAGMFTTSGTTGLPKLAVHSHFSLLAITISCTYLTPNYTTRLMFLPLFLLYGAYFGHIPTIRRGAALYIMPRFRMDIYLQSIKRYGITDAFTVPAMVDGMIRSPDTIRPLLESLRYAGVGGGQLSKTSHEGLKSMLHPDAEIAVGWGMTETGVLTASRSGSQWVTDGVGELFPGQEVKLVNADGQVITEDDMPGEAYIRSWFMFNGYYRPDGGVDLPVDEGNWFRTGDVLMKKGNQLCFVGRSKELIKVKGWQVAPAELEGLLMRHPQIADCAVIAVLLADGISERPRAYVVLKPSPSATSSNPRESQPQSQSVPAAPSAPTSDPPPAELIPTTNPNPTSPPPRPTTSTLTTSSTSTPAAPPPKPSPVSIPQEIYTFARSQLASYKALDGGVFIVKSIPRNAMGKVQRWTLPQLQTLESWEPVVE